jgi:hypothetical protein
MKSEWQVSRTTIEQADGQRRWDIAYQLLIQWQEAINNHAINPLEQEDKEHEDSSIHPRFIKSTTRNQDN